MKYIHVLGLFFCGFLLNAQAQTPTSAPDAPVPQAILGAKTAFVSNAMPIISNLSGGPTRGYNQFYADVKAMGRYELVDDPSKADIVFELQAVPFDSIRTGLEGVRLVIYDRRTHYILWTLVHPTGSCALKKGCDRNFDAAMDSLIRDLKALCRQSPSPTTPER
jgi:hypothetical protein